MTEKKASFLLYILMRTDLASMNPGKAVAQGAHAANLFMHHTPHTPAYKAWIAEGHGFGTTICLGVTEKQMRAAVRMASRLDFPADIVHDHTYPLRDGDTLHLIPLDTCAYVFGTKDDLAPILGHLSLHP